MLILKDKAEKEAGLLVKAMDEKRSLIETSDLISSKINLYTDLILKELQNPKKDKQLYEKLKRNVIKYHFPKILLEKFTKKINTLPEMYMNAIIASSIASTLIYKKGLDYQPNLFDTLEVEIKDGLF